MAQIFATDIDGVPFYRLKVSKDGWNFNSINFDATTGVLNSLVDEDKNGNDRGYASIKFFDSNAVELTTQASIDSDCVKTQIDFEAPFDIELIGGKIMVASNPMSNCRLHVIIAPDIPKENGGSKLFIEGLNLKLTGSIASIDGRTPKLLTYDATYHKSKIRLDFCHDIGCKVEMCIAVEGYIQ